MCGKKNSEKLSEFQMVIEPGMFQALVGCASQLATENSRVSQPRYSTLARTRVHPPH